jgi:hypothetical protein
VRALRALGLQEAVAARAAVIPLQQFLDHRGRVLADVDLASVWHRCGPCLALHRAELHAALRDGAAGVPLRTGVTLRALEPDRAGFAVGATFSDGSAGEYDLVVGAAAGEVGGPDRLREVFGAFASPVPELLDAARDAATLYAAPGTQDRRTPSVAPWFAAERAGSAGWLALASHATTPTPAPGKAGHARASFDGSRVSRRIAAHCGHGGKSLPSGEAGQALPSV